MNKWALALRLIGVGWYVAICILLGVWGGIWLDGRINTSPVFALVGLLAGIGVGFYGVYRMLVPLMSDKNDNNKGNG